MQAAKVQHGGRREGAGRKPKSTGDASDPYLLLAKAKAKREVHKANIEELNYKKMVGDVVDKHQLSEAASRMHASIAQALRSLPDELERKCGISPESAEFVERFIDSLTIDIGKKLNDLL